MKQLALIIFISLFIFACTDSKNTNNTNSDTAKKENNSANNGSTTDNNSKKEPVNLSKDFYNHFSGTIKNIPISADLIKRDDNITLIYYYDKVGLPITLSGKIGNDNEFTLKQMVLEGKPAETFTGKFVENGKIEGKWKMSNKNETLDFKLAENTTNSVKFKIIESKKQIKNKNEATCDDNIVIYYPVSNKKLQNEIAKAFFNGKTGRIEDLIKKYRAELFDNFKKSDTEMPWDRNEFTDIMYNDNGLLSYGIQGDEFTGGAHGNYYAAFHVFDIKTAKKYTLDDVFNSGYQEKLQKIIYQKIKIRRGISDEDMSNTFELPIPVSKNFYVNKAGIGFTYNPYEIASYADGSDEVFIKYKEIRDIVKQSFLSKFSIL